MDDTITKSTLKDKLASVSAAVNNAASAISGTSTNTQSNIVIEYPCGFVKFSVEEVTVYSRLFTIVDTNADGKIEGAEGAAFLRRGELSNDLNKTVWRLASGGKSLNSLVKDNWFMALKLVSLAQLTGICSVQQILDSEGNQVAEFGLNFIDYQKDKISTVIPMSDRVVVTIGEPEVLGNGYSKYTVYTMECTGSAICLGSTGKSNVKRRFSDFAWLYQRLIKRFPATIVPPIPEKRWTGNLAETFIEERRQGLEHFMNEVCGRQELVDAFELQVLLSATPEGLAAAKELLPEFGSKYLPSNVNMNAIWGTMKEGIGMTTVVQQVEIPTDDEYRKIGEKIDKYEGTLSQVISASESVYQIQRAQGYELSRFGYYLTELAFQQRQNELRCAEHKVVGKCFDDVSNLCQDQLDQVLSRYMTPMRYQSGKVDSIKVVMKNRESAIDDVQQANASMHRNKERFAAARALSGSATSASTAEKKMAEAAGRMERAKQQVDHIANSLKNETEEFSKNKVAEIRNALLSLTDLQIQYRKQAKILWMEAICSLEKRTSGA